MSDVMTDEEIRGLIHSEIQALEQRILEIISRLDNRQQNDAQRILHKRLYEPHASGDALPNRTD